MLPNESKIRVAGFGLQGFGNELMRELIDWPNVEIVCYHTRKSAHSFAYYDCESLESLAARHQIPLVYVPDRGPWECHPADLALVSSFHRIFKGSHLRLYRHFPLHPRRCGPRAQQLGLCR